MMAETEAYAAYALALDFDDQEYWSGGTQAASLDAMSGYSFTRSGEQGAVDSDGTVDFFAANTPAINGNGYHAYGALTNILVDSRELSTWSATALTPTADDAVAPDGTMTADKFADTAIAGAHKIDKLPGDYDVDVRTFSVFAKYGTRRYLNLSWEWAANYAAATFDLVAGTVTSSRNSGTGSSAQGHIVDCGNGWYRCVLVGTMGDTGGVTAAVICLSDTGVPAGAQPSYTGDGSYLHLWQAQSIAGNFPDGGPIIVTTGSTASIGASALAVSLANGTYSATYTFDDDSTQNSAALTIADGTLNLPADFPPDRNIIKQLLVP